MGYGQYTDDGSDCCQLSPQLYDSVFQTAETLPKWFVAQTVPMCCMGRNRVSGGFSLRLQQKLYSKRKTEAVCGTISSGSLKGDC